MEPRNATATQPRFVDYVRPLTARKWLILLIVVAATSAVYAYYAHKPKQYTAATLVYVHDPGDPVTGVPSPQATDRTVANQASLLYSRPTAAAVAKKIGYSGTAESLLQMVSITTKPGQDFLQITVNARSAREAAVVANAFAQHLAGSLNGAASLRIADAIKLSQTQLAQLPRGSLVQRGTLSDQINRLELALKVPTTVAQQVDTALPPGGPSAPKPVRNALFALVLSLVAAIALAYGIERFDRRLKDPEEMENAYGSPLLGVLPHAGDPAPMNAGRATLGRDFREPFRLLRTNIDLLSLDTPLRTIVVSSAMPGEGKSTVVRNLALAFRESGRRVAVVDLDLRNPALARLFGLTPGPGVTEALRHAVRPDEAGQRVPIELPGLEELVEVGGSSYSANGLNGHNGQNGHNGHLAAEADVTVLLAGRRPANPPAVLESERVVELLNELREHYDLVIVDSAPVLAVSDSVPLLRYADAALFVGRLDVTTRETAKHLMEFLERVPDVNLLGIVANDLSKLEAGAYGYGYGYAYGNSEADSKRTRRRRDEAERAKQPV